MSSQSTETRQQIGEFDENSLGLLNRIQKQLRENRFHFAAQTGLPIEKKKGSGKHRPVILAPIMNRVVQRALLDVLQDEVPAVKQVLETKTSIGGIPKRGTRHAFELVVDAITGGARWFASSDISGFFTKIPRDKIIDFIFRNTNDAEFTRLFSRAVETTLANEKELGEHRDLFPIGDRGVAQGSPLSPLMGNILLRDFDIALNGRGIMCVRYIDDFIILGPSQGSVVKAMKSAAAILADFGMEVYDPIRHPEKAGFGPVTKGFDFLGCRINPGQVAPSPEVRSRLMEKISRVLSDGKKAVIAAGRFDSPPEMLQCQVQTLIRIDGILKGWGHAFSFCNTPQVFVALDDKVDIAIMDFMQMCHSLGQGKTPKQRRRILGVHLLADTPLTPVAIGVE